MESDWGVTKEHRKHRFGHEKLSRGEPRERKKVSPFWFVFKDEFAPPTHNISGVCGFYTGAIHEARRNRSSAMMIPNRRSLPDTGEASRLTNQSGAEARIYSQFHLAPFATSVMDYSERAAGLNAAYLNASAMFSPTIPAVVPSQPGVGARVDQLFVPSFAAGIGGMPAGVMPQDYMLVARTPHFMPTLGLHHQENLRALQLSNQHHFPIVGGPTAAIDATTAAAAAGMVGLGAGSLGRPPALPFHHPPESYLLHAQPPPGRAIDDRAIPQQTSRKQAALKTRDSDPILRVDDDNSDSAAGAHGTHPTDGTSRANSTAARLRPSMDGSTTAPRGSELSERSGGSTTSSKPSSVARGIVPTGATSGGNDVDMEQQNTKPAARVLNDASPPGQFPIPLASDEDQNWLSEFLCFVRADLVEVFRASSEDVRSRNSSKKVCNGQVGIRCKHCAHLPLGARASRSSSYPSSLSRIYQSLTMMLRDHFPTCNEIPPHLRQRYHELKGKPSPGATDSKQYWSFAASKLGLVDSVSGIWLDENATPSSALAIGPFGASAAGQGPNEASAASTSGERNAVLLVTPEDQPLVSDFLYTLVTHLQLVHMEESERIGNRRSLRVGLPGIGCRHCCEADRKGLCRLFPARRRTLPNKVDDLYDHIRRCTLCPIEEKNRLAVLKNLENSRPPRKVGVKEFYDRIWARMGHGPSICLSDLEGSTRP